MKSEIGSEFWSVLLSETENCIFPENTQWFLSGRSALCAIISDIKKQGSFQTVAMPDWCCDSMILPFVRNGVSVSFYDAFDPPQDAVADVILVMDYFGYSSGNSYHDYPGIVIRDLTHSLFSGCCNDADYYFGSLRKWAGFYTGGFAWGFMNPVIYCEGDSEYTKLRMTAMAKKAQYITGESDSKDYLVTFADAEAILENVGVLPACDRDIKIAKNFDVEGMKAARRRNAQILLNEFSDAAVFPRINPDDCPMFVPIRAKNRNELRSWLIQNEIFCPVHWPISPYHRLSDSKQKLYEEELSLVCDQRYSEEDMLRMIETIRSFGGR